MTRLSEQVQYYHDAPSVLTVLRDGEEISVELTPAYDEESNLWMFGFDLTSKVVEITPLESIQVGTRQLGEYSTMMVRSVVKLVQGVGLNSVSGPVGIYQVTAQTASAGTVAVSYRCWLIFLAEHRHLQPAADPGAGRWPHRDRRAWKSCFDASSMSRVLNTVMLGSFALVIGLMLFCDLQ